MKGYAPETKTPEAAQMIVASASNAVFSRRSATHEIIRLQRAVGNQAVQRLIERADAKQRNQEHGESLGARIRAAARGQPLASAVQRDLEEVLGADLSGVRIHADAEADRLSRALDAVAFTTGRDVFFRSEAYNPSSTDGMRLLAHEATHVVQQASGPVAGKSAPGGVQISDPTDSFERQADRVSDAALSAVEGIATARLHDDGFAAQHDSTSSARATTTGTNTRAAAVQVQRQPVPVIPAASLTVAAASFVANTRPAGTDSFGNANVQFRYSRNTPGPHISVEVQYAIFELDTNKSFGSSHAHLDLTLRYDGQNIIAAYTSQARVSGYEGGVFGSEAAVNFNAIEASHPSDEVTRAYVLVQGFNNPSGPGFQRFRARILVTGDGKVEPQECRLTEGEGVERTSPHCFIGFTDRYAGYPSPRILPSRPFGR
jgi:Domain of unknown function (DUF4157)